MQYPLSVISLFLFFLPVLSFSQKTIQAEKNIRQIQVVDSQSIYHDAKNVYTSNQKIPFDGWLHAIDARQIHNIKSIQQFGTLNGCTIFYGTVNLKLLKPIQNYSSGRYFSLQLTKSGDFYALPGDTLLFPVTLWNTDTLNFTMPDYFKDSTWALSSMLHHDSLRLVTFGSRPVHHPKKMWADIIYSTYKDGKVYYSYIYDPALHQIDLHTFSEKEYSLPAGKFQTKLDSSITNFAKGSLQLTEYKQFKIVGDTLYRTYVIGDFSNSDNEKVIWRRYHQKKVLFQAISLQTATVLECKLPLRTEIISSNDQALWFATYSKNRKKAKLIQLPANAQAVRAYFTSRLRNSLPSK